MIMSVPNINRASRESKDWKAILSIILNWICYERCARNRNARVCGVHKMKILMA